MTYQSINLGATPNDGTGDALRVGGDKINDNFVELYAASASQAALIAGHTSDISALQAAVSGLTTGIVTSMLTSNSATVNAAALKNDIVNAGGQKIVIPAGTYFFGGGTTSAAACDVTFSDTSLVYLEFLPGAKLVCNTSGKNSTNLFFWFREGITVTVVGGVFDGGTIAEIGMRTSNTTNSPGGTITVRDARFTNYGWTTPDSATASVSGTICILSNQDERFVVDNCRFDNCRSKENATYSDQPGKCTFVQWFNASSGTQNSCQINILNSTFDAGAESNEGDDYDLIHLLNQASLKGGQALIHNCRLKFHGKTRRPIKIQGVDTKITKCRVQPTDTCTLATTGLTSITVTAATAATPGLFTLGTASSIPTGTYCKLANMAGTASWVGINGIEYIYVPVTSTTGNLFGPGAALNTTGLGTYNNSQSVQGTVRRTNDQEPTLLISSAVAATGVFTTRWGLIDNPHGFVTGDMVRFSNLTGGTWNTINDIDYYVVVLSPTTFSVKVPALLDTNGFGTYTGSSGTIARVNGVTEEGMAGVDCAGTPSCLIEIEDCYFNFSGLRNGIAQSTGKGATIHTRRCVIIGNRYDSNRFVPDSGANEVAVPSAWSTNVDDINSSITDCEIYGWSRPFFPAGRNNRIERNRCYDPRFSALDVGTTVRDGLVFCDNTYYTRTPYSLDQSADFTTADFHRVATIRNWTNVRVNRNQLIRQGNTLHGTGFICFTVNGVTGEAENNVTPFGSGCLPIRYTAGVTPINILTATSSGGAVTLNAKKGKITTESLSTAAGGTYTLTITNERVVAVNTVKPVIVGGANSAGTPILLSSVSGAGSVVIKIYNAHASAAFNNTLQIYFEVVDA